MAGPTLPPEILDFIVDKLHAEPATLKACCLVSKSLVPRTRSILFVRVKFGPESMRKWMKSFPDPSISPAHHTRILMFRRFPIFDDGPEAASALAWIHSFRNITDLKIVTSPWGLDRRTSLAPLYGLSPSLQFLTLRYEFLPTSEILNLVCSYPAIEDLLLYNDYVDGDNNEWDIPSTSPKLTGSLVLNNQHLPITRALLCLPNGLHFSKITLVRPVEDTELTMQVVSKCSDTLESLNIRYFDWDKILTSPAFDLSKYPKLKDVEFHAECVGARWIIATLLSAKPKSLQRITVHAYVTPSDEVGEWNDLDRLLSGLWTSHVVFLDVVCEPDLEGGVTEELFPGLADHGAVCIHLDG